MASDRRRPGYLVMVLLTSALSLAVVGPVGASPWSVQGWAVAPAGSLADSADLGLGIGVAWHRPLGAGLGLRGEGRATVYTTAELPEGDVTAWTSSVTVLMEYRVPWAGLRVLAGPGVVYREVGIEFDEPVFGAETLSDDGLGPAAVLGVGMDVGAHLALEARAHMASDATSLGAGLSLSF